ncbi:MAG: hypothetical protein ACJ764_08900 [Solirubrobacteraceae bacterium]
MKVRLPSRLRRPLLIGCGVLLVVGTTACGRVSNPSSEENDGVYEQGGNITYQLQVSRQLNPYSTEDSQYVKGMPPSDAKLLAAQLWYGVFMWAKNQTQSDQTTTSNFDIVDTTGRHYYPLPVSKTLNPYAWESQKLSPDSIEPSPNTTAYFGPTQGGLLLFKLSDAVYSNRPLTLEIRSPSGTVQATISLDL